MGASMNCRRSWGGGGVWHDFLLPTLSLAQTTTTTTAKTAVQNLLFATYYDSTGGF